MEKIEALVARLDEQRDAYLENHNLVRELLTGFKAGLQPQASLESPVVTNPPQTVYNTELQRRKGSTNSGLDTLITSSASKNTGEDSDCSDGEEDFYAHTPLEPVDYDHEGLRKHLCSYKWTGDGLKILDQIVADPEIISQPVLFPTQNGPVPDRSHLSDHQVFDIALDGTPLAIEIPEGQKPPSQALLIWQTIRELNNNPSKERKAVGRISILREPSPILFGAIHYTMHKYFDVDELFKCLVNTDTSFANLSRVYDSDERRRRTFVFNFEYFTIRGEECKPQSWQVTTHHEEDHGDGHHINITRCSSVVALYLGGAAVKKIRNHSRRAEGTYGFVYDPFAPWHVLSLQCYPDWKSSIDVHDSTKHYVNGVEAFMVTILSEFKDAHGRFETIYQQISKLVTPPMDFMFNAKVRNHLLFEDRHFTLTRRYFWAAQTLGIVNDSIRGMIDAYEDNFTDEVWSGTHKTIWWLAEEGSGRNLYFRKKMASLRNKFEVEIKRLRTLVREIEDRRDDIKGLREELFVGTSIQESRKSVENSEITVQQGHNIKLLTMVSIFFLPLTFVTSVFGMTNMPTAPQYWPFATVLVCVCVPFFLLVGSLNSRRGMHFWRRQTRLAFLAVLHGLAWIGTLGRSRRAGASTWSRRDEEDIANVDSGSISPSSHDNIAALRMKASLERNSSNTDRQRSDTESCMKTHNVDTKERFRNQRPPLSSPGNSSNLAEMVMNEAQRKRKIAYTDEFPGDVP